jgi:hypothetical protein
MLTHLTAFSDQDKNKHVLIGYKKQIDLSLEVCMQKYRRKSSEAMRLGKLVC